MDASRFIAGKLRFKGRLAMVSIAVSFFVIIVAVSVSSGFRHEIRSGISSICGDLQILPDDMNYVGNQRPVSDSASWLRGVCSLPGVVSVSPAVYKAGIVKSGDNIHGVLIKGVERKDTVPLGVSIPSALADKLSLAQGDDMLTYFIGEKVRVRKFRVTDVYRGVLDGSDNLVVFAQIGDMRRLEGWGDGDASCFEVMLDPSRRSADRMKGMSALVGTYILTNETEDDPDVTVTSAQSRYPQIFAWLDLIDFNVLWILILMIAVAGFNMISGLLILLFRNIPTIGTLKSLGMTDRAISRVFLRVASSLVLKGMAIGNGLALLFIAVQGTTKLIRLNPENYFVSFVPVRLNIPWILSCDAIAYVAIMILLLIPCLFVSRVDPAQTVRAQ
ncbi:MAG: ABC transporter permease [Bacteroidales bacterium]|nr:ABC transporter permease [Bacteroidales bacterium]